MGRFCVKNKVKIEIFFILVFVKKNSFTILPKVQILGSLFFDEWCEKK
jgi:hypothetical protein